MEYNTDTNNSLLFQTNIRLPTWNIITIVLCSFGIVLSLLTLFILIVSRNMTNKFFTLLKIYSINSLIVIINQTYVSLSTMLDSYAIWSQNYTVKFIFNYVNIPIWRFTYTFSSAMNIFITYERLTLFQNKWTFLRKTSCWKLGLISGICSLVLNIPPTMGVCVATQTYQLNNSNMPIHLYSALIKNDFYANNSLFKASLFISILLRDFGFLLTETTLNILLVIAIKAYFQRRSRVLRTSSVNNQLAYFNKTDRNNTIISFIVSFISGITHLQVLAFAIFNFFNFWEYFSNMKTDLMALSNIFNCINQSINFFFLLILNKRFRRNLLLLLPKIDIKKFKTKSKMTQIYDGKELINLETIITKL